MSIFPHKLFIWQPFIYLIDLHSSNYSDDRQLGNYLITAGIPKLEENSRTTKTHFFIVFCRKVTLSILQQNVITLWFLLQMQYFIRSAEKIINFTMSFSAAKLHSYYCSRTSLHYVFCYICNVLLNQQKK